MQKKSDILIVIPAFDEERSICECIREVREHYPEGDILVVDDASNDKTGVYARSLGVTVVRLPINLGIGGSVQTGIQWAKRYGYKVAVQFDGDGQHKAEYIRSIVTPVLEGKADLCIGSRFMAPKPDFKTTVARRIGMVLFSWMFYLITKVRITDTTSGLRAYGLKTLEIFSVSYPVDFPDMPALLALHRRGGVIMEVPVVMNQRSFGVSRINLWRSVWYPFKTLSASLAVALRQDDYEF